VVVDIVATQKALLVNAVPKVMVQFAVEELFVIWPQLLVEPAVTVTPPVAQDAVGMVLVAWIMPLKVAVVPTERVLPTVRPFVVLIVEA
jgi:hypothetical protein